VHLAVNTEKQQKSAKVSELTDCEADAECDVGNCVDAAVDRDVSQVHQISHDRHHCRVYHANCHTPAAVRCQQVVESLRKWNLKQYILCEGGYVQ